MKEYYLDATTWVDKYSDMLVSFAYLRLRDREAALDAVQDTFLAALRAKDTYRGEISEKNWLFLILKNKIIDHFRKESKKMITNIDQIENDESNHFDENGVWKKASAPESWSASPDSNLESSEFRKILNECISKLKQIQKFVFVLKYLDDKETDEICKEMEISTNNYWVIMHRAKLNLRKCIEQNWL